jgi:hypothetical protein
MNKTRSEECFEEIASRLEHEYMMNDRINSNAETDRQKEQYFWVLKALAAFCKLSWDDMNVEYRASQLSKYPPYATIEDVRAGLARMDETNRKDVENNRMVSKMFREAGL